MEISDKIALGALIISFLSLGFSIAAISIQKKLNTTNLQAIYYEEIFKDYLVKKFLMQQDNLHMLMGNWDHLTNKFPKFCLRW